MLCRFSHHSQSENTIGHTSCSPLLYTLAVFHPCGSDLSVADRRLRRLPVNKYRRNTPGNLANVLFMNVSPDFVAYRACSLVVNRALYLGAAT